jgi:ribose 5-phosphate isomerase B
MRVYLASDHGGFELKEVLVKFVREIGYDAYDCGAFTNDPADDYPSIIAIAAQRLSVDSLEGEDSRAIVVGASGQGEAIVANRFKGVRCATYYGAAGEQKDLSGKTLDMISSTREHNNANALSLGARFLSEDDAKKAVERWLKTEFPGDERHARRIKQIDGLS